jgi:hypothetical protein
MDRQTGRASRAEAWAVSALGAAFAFLLAIVLR